MNHLKDKKVLVTGGTGFVGSHLVESLIKNGVNVITTYLRHDPHSYFATQGFDKKVVMEHIDLINFDHVFDLVTKHEVDFIFHLAAQPLVDVAYYNPRRTLESNINGTINLLETMRLYPRISGMIVASSDKAYGKHGEIKYKEKDPLRGDHPYEVSKSAADLICNSYVKTYDLPVVTTRFGNIYGEGDRNFSRIIPGIMKALVRDEVLELRSDGSFVRDYLHVKDVINAYIILAHQMTNVRGEAFNFGSGDTLSVLDIIHVAEEVLNKKISFKVLNQSKNEIPYQSLDYSKIRKTVAWSQSYSLSSTLPEIFKWYSKYL